MPKVVQYFIVIFILTFVVKVIIKNIIIANKSLKFLNKYFSDEDKLYSLKEVAEAFRLEEDHFIKLIGTLEKYHYFSFFNKRGVTMVKISILNMKLNIW